MHCRRLEGLAQRLKHLLRRELFKYSLRPVARAISVTNGRGVVSIGVQVQPLSIVLWWSGRSNCISDATAASIYPAVLPTCSRGDERL